MHVRITRDPIDSDALIRRVGAPDNGAALLFLGVVRNHNDARPVRGVHYDAYAEMAEGVLREIADEAAERVEAPDGHQPEPAAVCQTPAERERGGAFRREAFTTHGHGEYGGGGEEMDQVHGLASERRQVREKAVWRVATRGAELSSSLASEARRRSQASR